MLSSRRFPNSYQRQCDETRVTEQGAATVYPLGRSKVGPTNLDRARRWAVRNVTVRQHTSLGRNCRFFSCLDANVNVDSGQTTTARRPRLVTLSTCHQRKEARPLSGFPMTRASNVRERCTGRSHCARAWGCSVSLATHLENVVAQGDRSGRRLPRSGFRSHRTRRK